jgi:hypothetical protein
MKLQDHCRFEINALRGFAGDKVFARGEAYYHDGSVQILSVTPQRVLAQVTGSDDYRTVLRGRGTKIGGECSCPAFEDWGFCKHMVATALAANAAGDGGEAEGAGALSRIRDHLKAKGIDALVDMIVGWAEQDPELFHRLDMASAVVDADAKTLEARLRKAIDRATRAELHADDREAPHWRSGVESALEAVADLVARRHADIALRLVERAMDRIEAAFETIGDTGGELQALIERASEIHFDAVRTVRPAPVALARDLFRRETEGSNCDAFADAAARYADVLGEEGLAEYRRLAAAAWDKLPSRSGPVRAAGDATGGYWPLRRILDMFAEQDGDLDRRIALRSKDLSSQWDYLELAEFLLSHGREEEALRRAEEGLWLFEDNRPDERLLFFAIKLLCKARRKADAEAHLWRAFEKAPSFEIYKQLVKLGGQAAGERAMTFLEAGLVDKRRPHWLDGALLMHILMHEKKFSAAWAAVRKHGASMHTKMELARAAEAQHPREALEVYAAQVEQLANAGSDYAEAAQLVARMAKLQSAAEQERFVADLKTRYARRRSFMKLLG